MHVLSVSRHGEVEKVVLAPGVCPREVANCLGECIAPDTRELEKTPKDRWRFRARFGASRSQEVVETVEDLFLKPSVRFVAGRGREGGVHEAIHFATVGHY